MIHVEQRFTPSVSVSILVLLSLIILCSPSCTSSSTQLKKEWEQSPCRQIDYWGENWKKTTLSKRIKGAPAELIRMIQLENELEGFTERPVAVQPPPELLSALNSIEQSMPGNLKAMLEERLVGIFAVKELGGTGYAEAVYDGRGHEKYAVIVLDADVLMRKNANEWATWKLNSVFKTEPAAKIRLESIIEDQGNDTVTNAVRFILLHEIGHVLGMVSGVHSSWIDWYLKKKISMDYPFQRLSWQVTEDHRVVSLFDDKFPERENVKVYSFEKAKLTNEQIPATFNNLVNQTDFPSLFAAENLWEDFAESFTTYFHVLIDKRPWQVRIAERGNPETVIRPCWLEKRCERKREFMKKWFENPF